MFHTNPPLDIRWIFLDLSKAFDRVWQGGLMHKLRSLGICGNYYRLIHSFLRDRHQKVILKGQSSNWSNIKAGVSQGLILRLLLFLVYINDLTSYRAIKLSVALLFIVKNTTSTL